MKHIQNFDEYNNINEELDLNPFTNKKKKLKNLFVDSFKDKKLESFKSSTDLTAIKTIFTKICNIIGGDVRIKDVDNLIKDSNVFVVDSMLTCIRSIRKDIDENRELIGWLTFDKEENKFRYHSYYN